MQLWSVNSYRNDGESVLFCDVGLRIILFEDAVSGHTWFAVAEMRQSVPKTKADTRLKTEAKFRIKTKPDAR